MEKKRDREQGGILGGVAELFDLPADVVAGLPRLELVGNRQLYLERHTGPAGLQRYANRCQHRLRRAANPRANG